MSFDWTAARADLDAIRLDNQISIALRRGDSSLSAQDMRIEYAGVRGFRLQSDAARQAQQAVVILGKYDMDVALDDRLTYGDVLFQVVFIQPNRLAGTIVEAIAVR